MRKMKRERKEKARNSEAGGKKKINKTRWKERREEGRLFWAQVSADTRKSEHTQQRGKECERGQSGKQVQERKLTHTQKKKKHKSEKESTQKRENTSSVFKIVFFAYWFYTL